MRRTFIYNIVLPVITTLFVNNILFAQNGTIAGKVKYGNDVLQAATVSLGNKTKLTDHNGSFSFSVIPGVYKLVITHAGYKKIEELVSVKADTTQILDFILTPLEEMGEVVVLGFRSQVERSNLNAAVPVDVFSSRKLVETGQVSLTQMLTFVAPSFNAAREVLDQQATLRGLDPDHVLILMNGTRYHNMATVFGGANKGQLGRGSAGNDLNSIPFSAIEKTEILRDGASAQYGSDAIAGVMNIQLKESTGKTSIQLHTGRQYEGDGEKILFGINRGVSLNKKDKKGFLNFSADYRDQEPTVRGGTYDGLVYYNYPPNATHDDSVMTKSQDDAKVQARGFNRKAPLENVGNLKYTSIGSLINGGYTFSKQAEIFWTAAYNDRTVWRDAVYRYPKDTATTVIWELYPDGFQPKGKPKTIDVSAIAGIKGETKNSWRWNFSSSFGSNALSNTVSNTNNASQYLMGKDAQTRFYTGKDIYKQLTTEINFTKNYSNPPSYLKSLNMASGVEWRLENYHTIPGDEASWKNYDTILRRKQGGAQSTGGNDPKYCVNKNRNALGTYLELETELNDHFLLDAAVRYEYYTDYGGNLAAKLAARFKFSDKFLLRASASNGFRAPSLQQRYLTTISTAFKRGGNRDPVLRGIFSNDDSLTKKFGIPSLTAEKSLNFGGGLTAKVCNQISLTIDAYWIQIKNRIVLSGIFDTTSPAVKNILDNFSEKVDQVAFFTNAINTRTKGIDITFNGNWKIGKSNLGINLAANFTSTRLFGDINISDSLPADSLNTTMLFDKEQRSKIEEGQPNSKIILSLTYKKGKTGLIIRNTYFGKTAISPIYKTNGVSRVVYESFSPRILTDINITYSLSAWVTLNAGVNNVFDIYPDRLKYHDNTNNGIWIYSPEASPFGFNGGYYYVAMSFNF